MSDSTSGCVFVSWITPFSGKLIGSVGTVFLVKVNIGNNTILKRYGVPQDL